MYRFQDEVVVAQFTTKEEAEVHGSYKRKYEAYQDHIKEHKMK